jgi:hypothetical protein
MIGLLCFALAALASPFGSRLRLEAENAALRHQLMVLRRRLRGRVRLKNHDRWFFIKLYRWFPAILEVLTIIRPETLVGWHRAGFRCYWRWKPRPPGGRPQIGAELREMTRRINVENPLWGAPRIHGISLIEMVNMRLRFQRASARVRVRFSQLPRESNLTGEPAKVVSGCYHQSTVHLDGWNARINPEPNKKALNASKNPFAISPLLNRSKAR